MIKQTILLGVLFSSSYAFTQDSVSKYWEVGNNKTTILKSAKHNLGAKAKLTKVDILLLEQLLVTCISTSNLGKDPKDVRYLLELKMYNRQYSPFVKDGHKFVLVNCFCDDVKHFPKWKKEIVTVYDGGGCYFTVLINLTKKEYSNLYIHGL